MRLSRRHTGTLGLVVALVLAGLALAAPSRPAGADSETFFSAPLPAPCPVAHCDQHLDGHEGLAIPVSLTPTVTTVYTPTTLAFNTALGCTHRLSCLRQSARHGGL